MGIKKDKVPLNLLVGFIIDQELIKWSKSDKTRLLYTFSQLVLNSKFIFYDLARIRLGCK
jgi:hypothetical protein